MKKKLLPIAILIFFNGLLYADLPEYDTALKQYQAGKYEDSLKTIRTVFDANPNSMKLRMLAAANYIKQGNYGSARDHLIFCIQDHPQSYQPRLYLAAMYRKTGKTQAALRVAKGALAKTGDSVHVRLEIAAIYLAIKKPVLARAHLARALVLSPQNFNVIFMDGLTYMQEGNLENAEFRFRNALSLPVPGKKLLSDLYVNLGVILESKADQLKLQDKKKESILKYIDAQKYYQKANNTLPGNNYIAQKIKALDKKMDE